ncbi:MAG: PleD family two-component system response regulator [Promethearchaeota archaeon]
MNIITESNNYINDKIKIKKDIKWYSYVDPQLDAKLKDFMEDFEIKNQASLIRTFVNNGMDYIKAVVQRSLIKGLNKYDDKVFDEIIRKAIDSYEVGNGFYEELKQKLSPLKLSILMLENHINEPEWLLEILKNIQQALEELEKSVKHHFEKPKLIRFVNKVDILYIEDNELERKTVETFFKKQGINIKSVETSEEGLYLLNIMTPKVILVDVNLKTSKINGDKLCQIIKSHGEYRSIPLILISAVVSKNKKQEILTKTGAEDIIIKPIDKLADLNVLLKYVKQS